ncbi:MAG TPA: hypothetical protein DEA22_05940 [Blastocatellia bacterium]|nr:hypothetical protein [Blastocatellia bacterium]
MNFGRRLRPPPREGGRGVARGHFCPHDRLQRKNTLPLLQTVLTGLQKAYDSALIRAIERSNKYPFFMDSTACISAPGERVSNNRE